MAVKKIKKALKKINSCEQREKKIEHDFESCKQESERQTNETQILRNNIGKCQQELKEANARVERYQQEATELKADLVKWQREAANKCSLDQSKYGSLQPIGNVVISLIRHVENAREIDACMGMSSDLGYLTSKQCCQANQVMLFDLETSKEIPIGINSIWIEEHVCFINTTEIQTMNFPIFDNEEPQACSILAFDESKGQFKEHQFDMDIGKCFDSPCSFKIDPNLLQTGTILNGTSVVCDEANQIGIVTKSKFHSKLIYDCSS